MALLRNYKWITEIRFDQVKADLPLSARFKVDGLDIAIDEEYEKFELLDGTIVTQRRSVRLIFGMQNRYLERVAGGRSMVAVLNDMAGGTETTLVLPQVLDGTSEVVSIPVVSGSSGVTVASIERFKNIPRFDYVFVQATPTTNIPTWAQNDR